jgi:NDP-sugar pyrophosphorylase family protein
MSLPVAILAGGLATRLPAARDVPKALVDVDGQPFAVQQIHLLRAHGLTEIIWLVGHLGEMIQAALGDGSAWGVSLRYVFDGPVRLGTGGAIRRARETLGEQFFVLYGDSYLECDYALVERTFTASGKAGLMTVCQNDDRWDRSNVEFEDGRIVRYDKQRQTAAMRHIDYGLGAFHASAFEPWPEGEAFDLADVYGHLLARGDLAAVEIPGRFYEIGSPRGLEETRAHLASKRTAAR